MGPVSIEQAKTQLPELIEAAVSGEEVVIAKDDQHLVKLVPVSLEKRRPQFGSAKDSIRMSDDFDESLKDFAEYME
jgi:antitoxin (DNA-binding transcriptional repressor) of toxin-antitoxin stability system